MKCYFVKHRFPCFTKKSIYLTLKGDKIGEALLCSIDIPPNTHFIAFDGVFRTLEDFQKRRKEGKGSYAVAAGANKVLDCFDKRREEKCQASIVNNCLNLVHSISQKKAVKIRISTIILNPKLQLLSRANLQYPPIQKLCILMGHHIYVAIIRFNLK